MNENDMKKLISSTAVISSSLLVALAVAGADARLQAASRKTDREHEGLKGQVKEIRVETAKLSNKSGKLEEGKRTLRQIMTYDESGNWTEEYSNSVAPYRRYTYDSQGNRFEKRSRWRISQPPTSHDFKNQISNPIDRDSSDFQLPDRSLDQIAESGLFHISKILFKHDERGNRIEESRYVSQFELLGKTVFTYDEKGNRTEAKRYTPRNLLYDRFVYTYDNDGNVIELSRYGRNSSISSKESYSYEFDSTGNWIKRIASIWVTKDGKSFFEPSVVTYRKIAYY